MRLVLLLSVFSVFLFGCGNTTSNEANLSKEEEIQEPQIEVPITSKDYMLNAEKSTLRWIGGKPTGQHMGSIDAKMGAMAKNSDGTIQCVVVMNMNTIKCMDIEDPEENKDLVDHLNNEDFFDVTNFPEAHIEIKEMRKEPEREFSQVVCELEIKNHKELIEFQAMVKEIGDSIMISGTLIFDRTAFEIKYKSKTIFPDLGDKFINDEIEVQFETWFGYLPPIEPQIGENQAN